MKQPLCKTHAVTAIMLSQSCTRRHAARLLEASPANLSAWSWYIVALAVESGDSREEFEKRFADWMRDTAISEGDDTVELLDIESEDPE